MMKSHLCCSTVLLLAVLGCGGGATVRCRGEGCECLQCPAGQQPDKPCGEVGGPTEGAGLGCQACPPLFFSTGLDSERCQPHTQCDARWARHTHSPGTEHSDAVCGDCLDGFQPSDLESNSTLSPCVKESPTVRAVRTIGGGAATVGGPSGGGDGAANANATRAADAVRGSSATSEEKTAEYAVFALVPVFCVMGLLGILVCNLLKNRGLRCTGTDKDTTQTDSPQKEGNGCPYIPDDPNEDTISVLVRLITEKKENAAALEELLAEYETKQMNMNKRNSIKFPGLTPLSQFLSLPRLCPHQSHLHTISGLSSLTSQSKQQPGAVSGCSRCAQRKWPPVLIPPLDALKDPLKPPHGPPASLPSLDPSTEQVQGPLGEGVCVDALRTAQQQQSPLVDGVSVTPRTVAWQVEEVPPTRKQEVSDRKQEVNDGAPAVLSVGRFQVAQIPEQKPVVVTVETKTRTPSSQESNFNPLFGGNPFRR